MQGNLFEGPRFAITGVFILLCFNFCIEAQSDWKKLSPLQSTREQVETILGKPGYFVAGSGIYRTEFGKFVVWYSTGPCKRIYKDEQSWNVPPKIMTSLLVYVNEALPLKAYLSDTTGYMRTESPLGYSRYLYTSADESFTYETIMRNDSSEFVYTISLEPGKEKRDLLCPPAK